MVFALESILKEIRSIEKDYLAIMASGSFNKIEDYKYLCGKIHFIKQMEEIIFKHSDLPRN